MEPSPVRTCWSLLIMNHVWTGTKRIIYLFFLFQFLFCTFPFHQPCWGLSNVFSLFISQYSAPTYERFLVEIRFFLLLLFNFYVIKHSPEPHLPPPPLGTSPLPLKMLFEDLSLCWITMIASFWALLIWVLGFRDRCSAASPALIYSSSLELGLNPVLGLPWQQLLCIH